METREKISREPFLTLHLIYLAILLSQVLFAGLSLFMQLSGMAGIEKDLGDVFIYAVPLVVFFLLAFSEWMFRIKLKDARKMSGIQEKLVSYRVAWILRFAILEGSSILAIVAYLLTGNLLFMAIAGFVLLVMLMYRPTRSRAIMDLELNPEDTESQG